MSNYAARFVSGLVGNPEDRFSDVAAHSQLDFLAQVNLKVEQTQENDKKTNLQTTNRAWEFIITQVLIRLH